MDYSNLHELRTANSHKADHTTKLTSIDNKLDGTAQIKMMALGTDGSQEQIGTDNNNNVKCNVVSPVLVYPHSSANAEGSPSTSFNCKVANTVNMKIEDLTSVIDADHSNHSRSIAVGLRCRTDPASNTTGQFIKSTDNAVHVKPEIKRDSAVLMAGVSLSAGATHGTAIDAREYQHARILGTNLAGNNFQILGSVNNTNYFLQKDILPAHFDSSFTFNELIENCPPYLKIKNSTMGGSETFTVHYSLIR